MEGSGDVGAHEAAGPRQRHRRGRGGRVRGRGAGMLVLTRRANQSIVIGADVTVTVLEIRGDQVRLGIAAARWVSVQREEVGLQLERAAGDGVVVEAVALEAGPES